MSTPPPPNGFGVWAEGRRQKESEKYGHDMSVNVGGQMALRSGRAEDNSREARRGE